jgi:hypothetical protein
VAHCAVPHELSGSLYFLFFLLICAFVSLQVFTMDESTAALSLSGFIISIIDEFI